MIRYPGSKAKLAKYILAHFPAKCILPLWQQNGDFHYAEPFVGAGAIASQLLPHLPRASRILLNDKDYWLICLWKAVQESPAELCRLIDGFDPTAERFYQFKEQDGSRIDPVEAGFRKLALHQMSFSGFGVRSGGPLGGRKQGSSKYNPKCRWNPQRLKQSIHRLHGLLGGFRQAKITCKDFRVPLASLRPKDFAYLDPPYYAKGGQLYKHNMTDEEHASLAGILHRASYRWVLSYDDHPRIRELYDWATIHPSIPATYTGAIARHGIRRKNRELIITAIEE